MFSSGGYFRGFNCPFFASGLCERPYCHYRHVKTEEEKVQSKAASSGYSDAQIEDDLTTGNGPAGLKGEAVKLNKYTGEPEIQTVEKTDVQALPHVNKYTGEPMVAQPSNEYVVEVNSHCKKYKPTDKKYNGELMGAEPVNEYTVEVNSNCRKYNPTNKNYNGGPMVTKPSNEYTVEVKSDCKKYNPTDRNYDGEQIITQPSSEYTVELNSNCKKYRPTDKQSLKSQRPKLQIHKPVQKINKYTGEPVVDIADKQTYTPEAKDFPEYNPTPINRLKPSVSKYQAGALDNENEQEYDPQSNFSTTSLLKPSQPMAIKRTFTYDPTTPDFNHPAKRAKGDLEEAGPEDNKDESDDGEMGMFSEDEEEEEIKIPTLGDSSEEEDSSKPSIITDVKVFENLLLPVMDHDNNSNETSSESKKLSESGKKSLAETKDHAKKVRTREKTSKSSASNDSKKNGHSQKERTSSKLDSSKSSKHSSSSKSRENSSSRASSSKSSVKDSKKLIEKQSSSHSSDKSSSKHTHHKSSTSSSSKPKSSSEKETPKKHTSSSSSSSKQKHEHSKHSAHDKSSNKQDHHKHSADKKKEQSGKSHKKCESSGHSKNESSGQSKHESSGHSKHESSGHSKHESRSKSSKETSKDSVKGESKKRDRSVSLDSNGSKRKIVDINLDLFGMDSDEEDSIPPLISDEEEEDPYEECLRIYNESNVSKPSPKKKSRTERSISEAEQSESVSIPGKKRTAHKGSREVTRKIPEKPHTKLSPAQIMHNRFVMMQKQAQEEAGRSQEASTSSSGKLRVAHQSIVNQKVKNGREGTKVVDGKTVIATASKTQKRTAHVPNVKNIKRPTIPAEYGSKVPISVRQRYLNSIIDECLPLYDNEEDAFKRGLEEELTVYKRASNKTVYLNVACNTIKRLRTEAAELTASPTKPTSPLKMSHEAVLGGKNATRTTYTLNRSGGSTKGPIENFKGSELYNRLARYIMTEEQLQENGFPRPDSENSSVAKIYTVSQQEQNSAKLKTYEKICVRCGKRFMVFPNGTYAHQEECSYHWGKAWKKKIAGYIETRYTCCQGDLGTEGCQIAKCHVHETNKWENRTGYMRTLPCSPTPDGDYGVYAMDCEMVYTQGGVELARVTVTDCENNSVYETLVRPDRKIIDYNTRFSGITKEDMVGVTTTIRDVQAVLLSLFTEKTILIGHSLESDLAAVKIIHDTVVDTSVVFPHRLGPPYKRALKTLMAEYMKKIIQDDVGGHDSQEDAISCMELMQWRVKEDARKEPRCS